MKNTVLGLFVLFLTSVSIAAPKTVFSPSAPSQSCKYYVGNKLVDGGTEIQHTSDYILGCNDGGGKAECQSGGGIKLSNSNNSCCHCTPQKK